jgi:hypothetical protein
MYVRKNKIKELIWFQDYIIPVSSITDKAMPAIGVLAMLSDVYDTYDAN